LIVVGGGSYLLANNWGGTVGGWNIQLEFERHIPFIPATIFIYWLIFPYLATPVFTVKKYEDFFKVICGYLVTTFVSASVFFLFPTTMARPELAADSWLKPLFEAIYFLDGPYNLFPSLHVSSVSYVGFVNWRFCERFRIPSVLSAILICLSTLTVKQHAVLDVIGGLAVGWSAFYVFFGRRE